MPVNVKDSFNNSKVNSRPGGGLSYLAEIFIIMAFGLNLLSYDYNIHMGISERIFADNPSRSFAFHSLSPFSICVVQVFLAEI